MITEEQNKRMGDIIQELKDQKCLFALRSSIFADDPKLLGLKVLRDFSKKYDIPFFIKIGGVEASRDIYEAILLDADGLIIPMIESPFALKKVMKEIKSVSSKNMRISIMIETVAGCQKLEEILLSKEMEKVESVTIGRGDLTKSLDLPLDEINSPKVSKHVKDILLSVKKIKKKTCIGGGVTTKAFGFLEEVLDSLDQFEDKRFVFNTYNNPSCLDSNNLDLILEFESLWKQCIE